MKKNSYWESIKKSTEIWWQGSRLTNDYQHQDSKTFLTWQQGMVFEDHTDGFSPLGYKEKALNDFCNTAPSEHLIKHLFKGRRLISSLVCTFIVPILPIEVGFRFINAAVDTWHHRVTEEGRIYYQSKTSIEKAGWWARKTVATIAKVCARATDFMIVTPANGFRNAVFAAPHALMPVQAGIDAYNAKPKEGVKQFFKTWGSACLAVVKGLFKASRPAAIFTPFGFTAPLGSAILASGAVGHAPVVGNALTSGLKTISNSGSYLPRIVSNAASIPTASGIAQAAVVNIIPPILPNSSSRVTKPVSESKTSDLRNSNSTRASDLLYSDNSKCQYNPRFFNDNSIIDGSSSQFDDSSSQSDGSAPKFV